MSEREVWHGGTTGFERRYCLLRDAERTIYGESEGSFATYESMTAEN